MVLQQEIDGLLAKAYEVRIHNPVYSIELASRAVELTRNGDALLHSKALSQLGLFYMIRGEFQHALDISQRALSHFEEIQDLKGVAQAKYNIGSVYYKTDNFHIGLQYLLDSLKIFRDLGDKQDEARVLKAIGTIYEYFGDQENAIDHYQQCIVVAQEVNDLNQVSNAYNPLSGIFLKHGQHELALSVIQKSIEIKEDTNDVRGLAFSLYGRGKVYLKLSQYAKAEDDFLNALRIQREMGDKLGEGMACNKLGLLYMEQQQYAKAEEFFLEAVHIGQEYNIQFIKFKAHYNLYLLARVQHNTLRALEYLERYHALKEAVVNQHTYNTIKSYEAISKIRTIEQEARIQKDKAEIIERKNAELDSFFYRISHDLKGPISSLLGLYNLVKIEIKDELSRKYFDLYQEQIERMNNIIMTLINLTRMNHGAELKAKVNFAQMVDECISSYRFQDNFKRISFVKQIDQNIVFHSEWSLVITILQNLIENAIKFARGDIKPYVGIFISQENHRVRIKVEDNGQGIQKEFQGKIFDMFFRANDRVPGTGLGLYIMKRAVERLKGEISFSSELNVGSAFTVILPIKQ